jgi:hypothetical protein
MANVLFNIVAARLYSVMMKIIGDHGVLFAIADDVKLAGPPSVLAKIVVQLHALALLEAGLKTQASKNRVYVLPSARETWLSYLEDNPRSSDPTALCLHDIPDGRLHPSDDAWPKNDGVNIIGTPLGSPTFVEEYLYKKLVKHKLLLSFIVDVANMGFSRESHKMLSGSAVPRLTHILKSVPKDEASTTWMQAADCGECAIV